MGGVSIDKKINNNKKKVNGKGQGGGTVNDIVAPQECVGVYSKVNWTIVCITTSCVCRIQGTLKKESKL